MREEEEIKEIKKVGQKNYQSFTYESDEQKLKKKRQKKRLFLGIMLLSIPLLVSFSYYMLHTNHRIHYPTLQEVTNNPYIYQYLNGTIIFLDNEGCLRVHDNRKNQLTSVSNYYPGDIMVKLLKNNWNNQLIMNSKEIAQLKWIYPNNVLNFYLIDSIEFIEEISITDCNPSQSYPLAHDDYLLSCSSKLFIYDVKEQMKVFEFNDFNNKYNVFVKQIPDKLFEYYIIFSSSQDQTMNQMISLYYYSLVDKNIINPPKLIYSGEHSQKQLNNIIIQNDFVILIFPETVMKYKKIPSTIVGQEFGLQLMDKEFIIQRNANLIECFEIKNDNLICYDQNNNSIILIDQWQVKDTLVFQKEQNIINIKQQCNDLFILNKDSVQRIIINPLSISEQLIFSQHGLDFIVQDLIVINQKDIEIQCY